MKNWIRKVQEASLRLWYKVNPRVAKLLEREIEKYGDNLIIGFIYPTVKYNGSIVVAQEYLPDTNELASQLLALDHIVTNSKERDIVIGTIYASLASLFDVYNVGKPGCVFVYDYENLGLVGMIYSLMLFSKKRVMFGVAGFDDAHNYLGKCVDGIDDYYLMHLLMRIDEQESVYVPDPSSKILPQAMPKSMSEILRTVYVVGVVNLDVMMSTDSLFDGVRQILHDAYDALFGAHPEWIDVEIDQYAWLTRFIEYAIKDRLTQKGVQGEIGLTKDLLKSIGFKGNLDFVIDLLGGKLVV